jgi:RNA 2',3'-cyclic 3'-phosphodiesterase
MSTIRVFIAIDLPARVKEVLGRISRELAGGLAHGAVRWVRPEQMHLTLRFLGNTPAERLAAVQIALDETAAQHAPFTLSLGELGCFPDRQQPRVIWAGLTGDEGTDSWRLPALKRTLDTHLASLGWEPETKPFRAHLTLGRVKDGRAVRELQWTIDIPPQDFFVDAICLIQSDLRSTGPVYTVRHRSVLGGENRVQ